MECLAWKMKSEMKRWQVSHTGSIGNILFPAPTEEEFVAFSGVPNCCFRAGGNCNQVKTGLTKLHSSWNLNTNCSLLLWQKFAMLLQYAFTSFAFLSSINALSWSRSLRNQNNLCLSMKGMPGVSASLTNDTIALLLKRSERDKSFWKGASHLCTLTDPRRGEGVASSCMGSWLWGSLHHEKNPTVKNNKHVAQNLGQPLDPPEKDAGIKLASASFLSKVHPSGNTGED